MNKSGIKSKWLYLQIDVQTINCVSKGLLWWSEELSPKRQNTNRRDLRNSAVPEGANQSRETIRQTNQSTVGAGPMRTSHVFENTFNKIKHSVLNMTHLCDIYLTFSLEYNRKIIRWLMRTEQEDYYWCCPSSMSIWALENTTQQH